MSFNAAALKLMADKGLSAHDVAEIAAAAEDCSQSAAAVRQARYRERGGGKIPPEMRSAVFERDGWACLDCGSGEYLQCDHIIPVSKGGETTPENLQALCRPCNAKKKDRIRKRDRARSTGNSTGNSTDPAPNERDNLTPTRKTKTEAKASSKSLIGPFVLPADIPAEPWAGWEDMRRKIRKVPTDHARSLAVAELRRLRDEEGWPPGEVLNHCTMNSYQGIFPPNRNRPNERSDRDPTTVAVERFLRGDVGSHAGTG